MKRFILCLSVLAAGASASGAEPFTLKVVPAEKGSRGRIEIVGLSRETLTACADRKPESAAWEPFLKVQAGDATADADRPPLTGAWKVDGDRLVFEPRFPVERGIHYRVTLRPAALAGRLPDGGAPIVLTAKLDKPVKEPSTVVAQVYPSGDKLPENLLKFYVHFSAPMARGGAYDHVHILEEKGKVIVQPFLEIDEEFWDATGKRIKLLIDPGRIKRGLKPREDLGPVLEEGKKYTLVIKSSWRDAEGQPLKAEFRKSFIAGPADESPPDPKTWKLSPPAGGREPVALRFPDPMDHALLSRVLRVIDARGAELEGSESVSDGETRWQFTPAKPWTPGTYRVEVDTILEDLAGNGVNRPFEVDEFRPVQKKIETKTVELPFTIPPPPQRQP